MLGHRAKRRDPHDQPIAEDDQELQAQDELPNPTDDELP